MPAPDFRVLYEFDTLSRLLGFQLRRADHNLNLKPSRRRDRFKVLLFYGDPCHARLFEPFLYFVVRRRVARPSGQVLKKHNLKSALFCVSDQPQEFRPLVKRFRRAFPLVRVYFMHGHSVVICVPPQKLLLRGEGIPVHCLF